MGRVEYDAKETEAELFGLNPDSKRPRRHSHIRCLMYVENGGECLSTKTNLDKNISR